MTVFVWASVDLAVLLQVSTSDKFKIYTNPELTTGLDHTHFDKFLKSILFFSLKNPFV